MVVLAVFGGIDTTRNQLGLAMSMFVEHPDQWRLLADRPELARNAVEEVMRVRPTTTWVTREAMEDFTYRDLEFKRGTTIHLFSNRPEPTRGTSHLASISRRSASRISGLAAACIIASVISLLAAT